MEAEDDVQIIMPPPPIKVQSPVLQITYQTPSPATTTTFGSTPTRNYDKFKTNVVRTLAEILLNCSDHPFFQGLLEYHGN